MQKDTRDLTVALDHLRMARDEVQTAMGHTERSISEAAARRALDHLNLVIRHLEHEPVRRHAISSSLEEAFAFTQTAWQRVHDYLNSGAERHALLADVRDATEDAIRALETACQLAPEEAMHA